ncbi:hypothetical protein K402DRAFT_395138 [Aulographum hederae CBS 113979]|uniref:Transcription factor CBF/NF-Y/archaeal histone domain-containing protein n=1 Tax=Aulographum hederae CBS 113979 TaxID=1176131 RepID=A0A6G1GWB3_9PEZI|nr:hypothetical protein K402DRAFT_395138 [Aulographum hederae CBS 113979]
MPYNNTPIAPPSEFTGTVSLPLARVKKIIHADDEVNNCSNNAAFAIAVATEMFVQYLVDKVHDGVKTQRRRQVKYEDVSDAVARADELEFLSEVVPKTTTYKVIKERNARKAAAAAAETNNSKTPSALTPRGLAGNTASETPEASGGPSTSSGPAQTKLPFTAVAADGPVSVLNGQTNGSGNGVTAQDEEDDEMEIDADKDEIVVGGSKSRHVDTQDEEMEDPAGAQLEREAAAVENGVTPKTSRSTGVSSRS